MGGLLGFACETPLPARGAGVDSRGPLDAVDAGGSFRVRFDPEAPADGVSPVTRITVLSPQPLLAPRVLLVPGALSVSQLRDLGRSNVPQTLSSRSVSALVWLEADPTLLVVAPLTALEPGASYTLALSEPLVSFPFTVTREARPALGRVWPDRAEVAPSARAAVWCGPGPLGPLDTPATLEPALLAGRFTLGTGASIPAPQCIGWFTSAPMPSALDASVPPAVPPASVTFDDGSSETLEPIVLFGRDAPPAPAVTCLPAEIPFGSGCADVQDDRIVVRPGDDPLLWTLDLGDGVVVRSTRGAKTFTLRPLPIGGVGHVGTLDRSGRVLDADVEIRAADKRAHIVLNEILANPAGAEPAQEWVELYNDGTDDVSLAGFVLEDGGGRTQLPDASLASGAFAIIASDAFVADDGVDPPPAPGALLLRVPALGRAGLSNEGEMLTLRGPTGAILSTFPPAKTKNGVSIARIAPDAPDADAASFVPSPNGSATPGAPNVAP